MIDDEDEEECENDGEIGDCRTCGGCGGGAFTCPYCHGSGRDMQAVRRRREDWLEDQWDAKQDR